MTYAYQETKFFGKTKYSSAKCVTVVDVCENADGSTQQVKIETSKGTFSKDGQRRNGVTTVAYLSTLGKDDGKGYRMESTLIFGNGHAVIQGVETGRVTDKAVKEAHDTTLQNWIPSEVVSTILTRVNSGR